MVADTLPAIRADTVLAAVAAEDEEDARTTNVVCNLGFTRSVLRDLSPREWEEVAAYLYALLEREPLKSGSRYTAPRIIVGSLATELRTYAHDAGFPVGLRADLRDAGTQAEERQLLERVDAHAIAFSRSIDDAIAAGAAQRAATPPEPDPDPQPPEEPMEPVTPPPDDQPDDFVLP